MAKETWKREWKLYHVTDTKVIFIETPRSVKKRVGKDDYEREVRKIIRRALRQIRKSTFFTTVNEKVYFMEYYGVKTI